MISHLFKCSFCTFIFNDCYNLRMIQCRYLLLHVRDPIASPTAL